MDDFDSCDFTISSIEEPEFPFVDISGENGPDLWKAILSKLPVGAFVAGGAIRDWFFDVPPKDIDIFMPSGVFQFYAGFQALGDDRSKEYEALTNIDVVLRGEIAGIQVDLVGVSITDIPSFIETFDFAITRSWFDVEGLHDTPAAALDRQQRTVTLLINDRPDRAHDRFTRFNERMGGIFMFKVPRT